MAIDEVPEMLRDMASVGKSAVKAPWELAKILARRGFKID